MGIVPFGHTGNGEFKLGEELVIEIQQLKINLDAFAYSWIREVFADPLAIGLIGDFLFELREVVLAVGVLDVS